MSELMEAQSLAERAIIERDAVAAALSELRAGLEAAGLDHRLYCSKTAAEVAVDTLRASTAVGAQADLVNGAVAGLPVTWGSPNMQRSLSPTQSGSPTSQGRTVPKLAATPLPAYLQKSTAKNAPITPRTQKDIPRTSPAATVSVPVSQPGDTAKLQASASDASEPLVQKRCALCTQRIT
jgi:hypothetical protein